MCQLSATKVVSDKTPASVSDKLIIRQSPVRNVTAALAPSSGKRNLPPHTHVTKRGLNDHQLVVYGSRMFNDSTRSRFYVKQ